MNGIQSQIENRDGVCEPATEDDFISLMEILINRRDDDKPHVLLTGVGGYLQVMFKWHGRRKLPRKLKKRIYLTKKLRKYYIPQYYKK